MATVLAGFEDLPRRRQPDDVALCGFKEGFGLNVIGLFGLVERPAVNDTGDRAAGFQARRNKCAHSGQIIGLKFAALQRLDGSATAL